jgi:hypothetical protein
MSNQVGYLPKTPASILASALVLLTSVAPSWAGDQTKFEALVHQYLPKEDNPRVSFAPKNLCICEPGTSNAIGVLVPRHQGGGILATCNVPVFANGAFDRYLDACDYYAVIAK